MPKFAGPAGLAIDLGRFEPCVTDAIGPGRRAGVWVNGCSFRCAGCCSPELQEHGGPEHQVPVGWLLASIDRAVEECGIEGVTFSGGEPFGQAAALAQVAAWSQVRGLSVLSWTGYTLDELHGEWAPPGSSELLAQVDVLIDGPFDVRRQASGLPLRGSANQRIHLLSGRYRMTDLGEVQVVELRLELDGSLTSLGVVDPLAVEIILRLLGGGE